MSILTPSTVIDENSPAAAVLLRHALFWITLSRTMDSYPQYGNVAAGQPKACVWGRWEIRLGDFGKLRYRELRCLFVTSSDHPGLLGSKT